MAHGEINTKNLDLINSELIELSLLDDKYSHVKNIQVVLMSDCENIKKLNYYIFSNVSDVDYYTIDDIDESDLSMLDSMDIIVYNKDDEKLKQILLHNIKAKNLQTKFFVITNKNYLRQKDILKEHIDGVDKLLKMEFFLEDYILSVEKYLHSNFYSKRIFNLEDAKDIVLNDKNIFDKKIEEFISKKIFFSLFNYNFSSEIDINSYNIRKIVRECDYIYVDEKNSEITFLLLNVIPEYGAQLIKTRINNFSITLEENHKLSAFDLIYEN